jgi:hypothetical protein
MEWNDELRMALKRAFPESAVKWRATATNKEKTRALAVAYIDARNVMERLDRTVGPGGWSDDYFVIEVEGETAVQCSLTVLGVTKADVGELPDPKSKVSKAKSAYSDALKRAAVKFGIGRYLYALPSRWVGYDKERNRLTETPELPDWARPEHIEEKPAQDPGESLPDPEPEPAEPVSREDVARAKEATRSAEDLGEYVLNYGTKFPGLKLVDIYAKEDGGPAYLKRISTSSRPPKEVRDAVRAFLDVVEPAADQEPMPKVGRDVSELIGTKEERDKANGKHWSESKVNARSFWAQAKGMKLKEPEVRKLFTGAENGPTADFPCPMGVALQACRAWAIEQGRIER